jgi:hypothetical protein
MLLLIGRDVILLCERPQARLGAQWTDTGVGACGREDLCKNTLTAI